MLRVKLQVELSDGADLLEAALAALGAAKNFLASRLKALMEHGLVEIVPAADGSTDGEYCPTEKAWALIPVLVALTQRGTIISSR